MPPTPITRDNCWSVRQCMERAAALLETSTDVLRGLDAMAEGVFGDMPGFTDRCSEHQAVAVQLDHLHTLVEHCIANLRGGFAAPATPIVERVERTSPPLPAGPPKGMTRAPRPLMPPKDIGKWAPQTATPVSRRGEASRALMNNGRAQAREQARLEGLLGVEEFCAALGIGRNAFYLMRTRQHLPEPTRREHGMCFWTQEQVEAVVAQRNASLSRPQQAEET